MSNYDKIAWLPLCGGLTGLGLLLSYLVMRRRGIGSGLRGVAWSALPMAAYLTGAIEMFWKMGVAVGDFAKGFAFSPKVWSGIALAGFAFVLFVVSGAVRGRRQVKQGKGAASTASGAGAAGALAPRGALDAARPADPATAKLPQRRKAAAAAAAAGHDAADDDLSDVEEILRRRGIS
jgi:hypothetical protein